MPKTIIFPDHAKVNEEIIEKLDHLLESVPPDKLKNHLTRLFVFYVIHEHDSLPLDFDDIAYDIYFLIDFLILAEEELGKVK